MLQLKELKKQLDLIRERHPALASDSDEDLLPIWVLLAVATSNEPSVLSALCGGPYDGGMDAIFVDRNAVWIVQGKLRREVGKAAESAKDVRAFAAVVEHLYEGPKDSSEPKFWTDLDKNQRGARQQFEQASSVARKNDLPVHLIFATTGRFPRNLETELARNVSRINKRATLDLLDARQLEQLLTNYVRDVAPAVPSLKLRVDHGEYKPDSMGDAGLKAWTVATSALEVANLQQQGGEQVFARNIRHGLGDKVHVNRAIRKTLETEPHRFWFLNNGLTITCDSARMEADSIVMRGAQIINGQQTTRTITACLKEPALRRSAGDAQVAVRVISFESVRDQGDADTLVAQIVEASNFQNAISKADLRSNDIRQIDLMRALNARGYLYIRKRGKQDTPSGLQFLKRKIKREELFTAAAGTLEESVALREGRTPLFDPERPYYDQVLALSLDQLLAAWFFWKDVNSVARGSAERQGAKYLVHFYAYRELKRGVGRRFDRLVKHLERRDDPAVDAALRRLIDAYFRGAIQSYRKNKAAFGMGLLPKQFHQRQEAGPLFEKAWRGSVCSKYRRKAEEALAALADALEL